MAMELDDSSPMLLLCAHSGASHFLSLFHLAKRLLCHGFLITVVTPSPEFHACVSDQGRLRFESLTALRDADILKSPRRILDLSRSFSDLVSRLGAKSGAIRCVVADYFAGYVYDAVDFFDLPLVLYFPESATSAAFNLQLPVLLARRNKIIRQAVEDPLTLKYRMASLARIPLTEDELDECLPKLNALGVALSREQLHHYMRDASVQLAAKKCERLFYARLASWILVPSFEELEPACKQMHALYGKRFLPVGPLLDCNEDHHIQSLAEGNEDLAWLDQWPPGSVVYISPGTNFYSSLDELVAVVGALEALEQPFLLVCRSDEEKLLQELGQDRDHPSWRTSPWVPQKFVLDHPATGAFVTHCGWMSILEGVSSGVAMVAWPREHGVEHTDHYLNSKCIVEDWKIAIAMKKCSSSGQVSRESARESFEELLHGEGGKRARENVARLSDLAKRAAAPGGSSAKNLKTAADAIKSGKLVGTDTALLARKMHMNPWNLSEEKRAHLKSILDSAPAPAPASGFLR